VDSRTAPRRRQGRDHGGNRQPRTFARTFSTSCGEGAGTGAAVRFGIPRTSRIFPSISAVRSGLSLRNTRAFSRPCPRRISP